MKRWLELGFFLMAMGAILFPVVPRFRVDTSRLPRGNLPHVTGGTPCDRVVIDRHPYRWEPRLIVYPKRPLQLRKCENSESALPSMNTCPY
jgi:hypothetical protein